MNVLSAVALLSLCGLCAASPAAAQEGVAEPPPLIVKMTVPADGRWPIASPDVAERGALLPMMYASLIGLELYDGISTTRGLANGAVESNGLQSTLTEHPETLWAAKAASTVVAVYFAERLWRHHRRGQAIAVMIASNGIMALVAANNASVLRTQR
jgi:hypothetical protein